LDILLLEDLATDARQWLAARHQVDYRPELLDDEGLLHQRLLPSLQHYLHTGRHTIRAWADTHCPAWAVFEQPHDHPLAFYNANTLQELQQLEQWCAPPSSPP